LGLFDLFKKNKLSKKSVTMDEYILKRRKEGATDKEIKDELMVAFRDTTGFDLENLDAPDEIPSDEDLVEYRWVVGKCEFEFDEDKDFIIGEMGENFINAEGICKDCLGRNDEINTMAYWKVVGMPKSGFSMCQLSCGCRLQEVK
jgi:hypothetical protein|tara:strand:+ start:2357 stop:2791 length:435 start_codon:yes stop_codon:yes gene_type:complete